MSEKSDIDIYIEVTSTTLGITSLPEKVRDSIQQLLEQHQKELKQDVIKIINDDDKPGNSDYDRAMSIL